MKKLILLLLGIALLMNVLTSCNNSKIIDAEETPDLLHAQKIICSLYGEGSYQYQEIENELVTRSGDNSTLYDDLTFYQVYKGQKALCKIAVNPETLIDGVKTPRMSTYKQIVFSQDGSVALSDNDL